MRILIRHLKQLKLCWGDSISRARFFVFLVFSDLSLFCLCLLTNLRLRKRNFFCLLDPFGAQDRYNI